MPADYTPPRDFDALTLNLVDDYERVKQMLLEPNREVNEDLVDKFISDLASIDFRDNQEETTNKLTSPTSSPVLVEGDIATDKEEVRSHKLLQYG